ncbi:Ferric reduction oxidase 2 [Linum perenne]
MFIALLSWSVYSYLHAMFAPIRQEAAAQGLWELKLSSTGLTLGLVGNICLAFIFFPVTRGSSVLQMIGLTSESSIKYHIWLGHMAMTLFTLHGLCYVVFWAETTRLLEMMKWDDLMVANVAGEVALAAGLLMFLRSLQSQQRVRLVSARVLPCRAVELNFAKSSGLRYNPTSSMFINIPSISKLQWHPFSVTSSSKLETDRISVVIKSEGHWTTKLYQKLSSPSSTTRLDVSVEGPYGPASSEFMRHDTLVLVSGGSGITPFISIIREILCLSNTKGIKTPKVLLICAFKHCADLTILDLLLPVPGSGSTNQTLDISLTELQIEAFVTREKERKSEEADEQNQIRTLWFRPNQEDTPVAAALGPNSWIWLGGIISGSFVIYLVLMGLIMEYFVYPIDDNTNQRFSTPAKAALNILSICVAIVASSALGFLWNRRGHGIENVRVVNREMLPPSTNLSEGNGDAETEVESQPGNAIQQATTVHFGKRPNMKRILLDVEGENVGVLASGPKKLRQRVANFCSSSMADNLHFHSISFTW